MHSAEMTMKGKIHWYISKLYLYLKSEGEQKQESDTIVMNLDK